VLAQVNMTAEPDLSAAREKGVLEELLRDIEGSGAPVSAVAAREFSDLSLRDLAARAGGAMCAAA
jgi:hypothetical protein